MAQGSHQLPEAHTDLAAALLETPTPLSLRRKRKVLAWPAGALGTHCPQGVTWPTSLPRGCTLSCLPPSNLYLTHRVLAVCCHVLTQIKGDDKVLGTRSMFNESPGRLMN